MKSARKVSEVPFEAEAGIGKAIVYLVDHHLMLVFGVVGYFLSDITFYNKCVTIKRLV